jgi:hypothetical protein
MYAEKMFPRPSPTPKIQSKAKAAPRYFAHSAEAIRVFAVSASMVKTPIKNLVKV